jgi:hypothetical protein
MNRLHIFALSAVVLLAGITPVRSQATGTPAQRLQELKEKRAKLIDQQTATLQKLEELHKEAGQLRIFARRT